MIEAPKPKEETTYFILDKKLRSVHERNITGGIPACMASSAAAKAVSGVSSEGFMTTVQPHARAGPT